MVPVPSLPLLVARVLPGGPRRADDVRARRPEGCLRRVQPWLREASAGGIAAPSCTAPTAASQRRSTSTLPERTARRRRHQYDAPISSRPPMEATTRVLLQRWAALADGDGIARATRAVRLLWVAGLALTVLVVNGLWF